MTLFCVFSCALQRDSVKSVFQIETNQSLTIAQGKAFAAEVENRLAEFGFRGAEAEVDGDKLVVVCDINLEHEKSNYYTLFESNELGFWNVFELTDAPILELDSTHLTVEHFTPYYEMEKGYYTQEVLGVCKEERYLEAIKNELSEKLSATNDLKLFWTKEPSETLEHYQLYMINTKGQNHAPITERDLASINISPSQYTEFYNIDFNLEEEAAQKWSEMTEIAAQDNNRAVAIVINDRVISVPRVMSPIYGGRSSVSGNFNQEEAETLARKLAAGRLTYELELLEERILGVK